MKIKNLGYAAVGATLSVIAPSYVKRLRREATLKSLAAWRARREREEQNNRIKGATLDQCDAAQTKRKERCNHKKGGSLGRLTAKVWHHNGWDPGDTFVDGKFVPKSHFETGNGLSRWEGEWRGENDVISGKGDSGQYAVTKHTFANGDMHVRCLRCGKTWKPGDADYETARDFPTLNAPSTSVQWGGGEDVYLKPRNTESEEEKKFQENYKRALGNRYF